MLLFYNACFFKKVTKIYRVNREFSTLKLQLQIGYSFARKCKHKKFVANISSKDIPNQRALTYCLYWNIGDTS